jgi:Taurine catabolism dioxygenase TauD, TfdA family
MRAPITGPAVWTAEDLRRSSAWIHRFTAAEVAEIMAASVIARGRGRTIATVEAEDFPLPTVAPRLRACREMLEDGPGAYLFRGFPAADLPKDDLRFIYWALGKHLGTAVSQSADGDVLGDVRNLGLDRIYTSNRKGEFHCDSSDVVGLFVLRHAKAGGLTQIASSAAVHNEILATRPNLLEVLYQPFRWSWMRTQPEGRPPYFSQPIFSVCDGKVSCIYIPGLIRRAHAMPGAPALTPEQQDAMALLERVCDDERFHLAMHFEPGDIQLLNNHVCIHGRTAFEDFDEPDRRRHLLRLWLAMPNSRRLAPARAEYWKVEPGAVRGGFASKNPPVFETTGEHQT